MSGKFSDQVAAVTGGSAGIGFSIAQALIAEGAKRVCITGRAADTLEAAVARLGDKAVAVVSDVSRQADLDALKTRPQNPRERVEPWLHPHAVDGQRTENERERHRRTTPIRRANHAIGLHGTT